MMPSPSAETIDLLDLKLLPAWVKESSAAKSYAHYEGDGDERERPRGHGGPSRDKRDRSGKRRTSNVQPASAVDGLRRGERPTFNADKDRARRRLDRKPRDRSRHRGQNRIQEGRDQ